MCLGARGLSRQSDPGTALSLSLSLPPFQVAWDALQQEEVAVLVDWCLQMPPDCPLTPHLKDRALRAVAAQISGTHQRWGPLAGGRGRAGPFEGRQGRSAAAAAGLWGCRCRRALARVLRLPAAIARPLLRPCDRKHRRNPLPLPPAPRRYLVWRADVGRLPGAGQRLMSSGALTVATRRLYLCMERAGPAEWGLFLCPPPDVSLYSRVAFHTLLALGPSFDRRVATYDVTISKDLRAGAGFGSRTIVTEWISQGRFKELADGSRYLTVGTIATHPPAAADDAHV